MKLRSHIAKDEPKIIIKPEEVVEKKVKIKIKKEKQADIKIKQEYDNLFQNESKDVTKIPLFDNIKEVRIKKEDLKLTKNDTRIKSKEKFEKVIDALKIDESLTKSDIKQKKFNKFSLGVVPEAEFNYMADLIHLPTTKKGFKWLLVVLDLATNAFDIEAMKNKSAITTKNALVRMFNRKGKDNPLYLHKPKISLKTDGGGEFEREFDKYLRDAGIFHKVATPYRKKQMGAVEGLNSIITRLLMNYINKKSIETKTNYNDWTDKEILPKIRSEVNKFRRRDMDKLKQYQSKYYFDNDKAGEPTYNIGEFVHWKLDRPVDINGNVINDGKFRNGDRIFSLETRAIDQILYFSNDPYYRYKLKDMPNISFSMYELKKAESQVDTYIIKKIINKKVENKTLKYLVSWKNKLQKDATWENATSLVEDDLQDYIDDYEERAKEKAKKARQKNK